MRRINTYKRLFKIEKDIDLKEIKTTYRNLVKEWHPDKFQDPEKKIEAEKMATKIIDAYHFLVSIAPETIENNIEAYTKTISTRLTDYQHKDLLLEVSFADGNTYEYFGVNKKKFNKFLNARSMNNYGKRHIFNTFLYRKAKRTAKMDEE